MSIFEYDEEKELKLLRESEREYGIEIGRDEERIANIKKLVEKLDMTMEQAMDILDILPEKRNNLRERYEEGPEYGK